jgi:hypothetical protein
MNGGACAGKRSPEYGQPLATIGAGSLVLAEVVAVADAVSAAQPTTTVEPRHWPRRRRLRLRPWP